MRAVLRDILMFSNGAVRWNRVRRMVSGGLWRAARNVCLVVREVCMGPSMLGDRLDRPLCAVGRSHACPCL